MEEGNRVRMDKVDVDHNPSVAAVASTTATTTTTITTTTTTATAAALPDEEETRKPEALEEPDSKRSRQSPMTTSSDGDDSSESSSSGPRQQEMQTTAGVASSSTSAQAPVASEDTSKSTSAGTTVRMMDAEAVNLDDCEEEEEEEEDDEEEEEVDEDLFRRIISEAAAQGIPLEFLAHMQDDDDDDEDMEYPFSPPQSLQDVAQFILSDACQNILVLAGAGMSVASGIPDFRSSNGLYATLDADKLTATLAQRERIKHDPSYCLDQHLFLENQLPCLEVNRDFILGMHTKRWKATLAHRFVEGLAKSGKLVRLYTQNIDGLEDQCPRLPHSQRIAVHGSMDEAVCATCDQEMPLGQFCDLMQTHIKDIRGQDPTAPKESTSILCPRCNQATIKPNIVLFRSSLPKEFFQKVPKDIAHADLLIVMGTSLGVAPANSLVWRVPKTCMRVLLNRDPVGWHLGLDFNKHIRDYFGQGSCEPVVLELMKHLGWWDDLKPLLEQDDLPESSADLLRTTLATSDDEGQGEERNPSR